MHCLEIIRKMNNEGVVQVNQSGKFTFSTTAGCMVYLPPELDVKDEGHKIIPNNDPD